MTGGCALMMSFTVFVTAASPSVVVMFVAVILTLNVPATVGVPLIAALLLLKVKPLGSPLTVKAIGEVPEVCITCEYDLPTTPLGRLEVLIVGLTGLALIVNLTVMFDVAVTVVFVFDFVLAVVVTALSGTV